MYNLSCCACFCRIFTCFKKKKVEQQQSFKQGGVILEIQHPSTPTNLIEHQNQIGIQIKENSKELQTSMVNLDYNSVLFDSPNKTPQYFRSSIVVGTKAFQLAPKCIKNESLTGYTEFEISQRENSMLQQESFLLSDREVSQFMGVDESRLFQSCEESSIHSNKPLQIEEDCTEIIIDESMRSTPVELEQIRSYLVEALQPSPDNFTVLLNAVPDLPKLKPVTPSKKPSRPNTHRVLNSISSTWEFKQSAPNTKRKQYSPRVRIPHLRFPSNINLPNFSNENWIDSQAELMIRQYGKNFLQELNLPNTVRG